MSDQGLSFELETFLARLLDTLDEIDSWRHTRAGWFSRYCSDLIVASSLFRLRAKRASAEQIVETAAERMSGFPDPIHVFLRSAFLARLAQTVQELPRDRPLPQDTLALLDRLSRVERYKVDVLRAVSPTLAADVKLDPGSRIESGVRNESIRRPFVHSLRALDDRERVVRIEATVSEILGGQLPDSEQTLRECIESLACLPEGLALPVLASSVPLLCRSATISPLATALTRCAHFGYGELALPLAERVSELIPLLSDPASLEPVPSALRALLRLGWMPPVEQIVCEVDAAMTRHGAPLDIEIRMAGVLAHVRSDVSAPCFSKALLAIEGMDIDAQTIPAIGCSPCELVRVIAAAASLAPVDFALEQIGRLCGLLGRATDKLSTSSHYNWSLITCVESISLGVADLFLLHASPRSLVGEIAVDYGLESSVCRR